MDKFVSRNGEESFQLKTKMKSEENPRLYPSGIQLTNREAECFYLLARFSTIKRIASVLKLSPRTVESYVNDLKNKMGINYKAELIEKAVAIRLSNSVTVCNST